MPSKVVVRPYLSPTLVFLAFDWPDGDQHADFLGFAIQRKPGHAAGGASDFLFNKLGFTKPGAHTPPHPSDKAPIQKFHWWDSGISDTDRGKKFTYTVIPVLGSGPNDLHPQTAQLIEQVSLDLSCRRLLPDTDLLHDALASR